MTTRWGADEDAGNSTDTMSEGELVHTPEWHNHPGPFRGTSLEILRCEYLFARAPCRHSAGKRTRHSRLETGWSQQLETGAPQGAAWSYKCDSSSPHSLVGGQGARTLVGRKGDEEEKRNPRGPDGRPLRCLTCVSETHMFDHCPAKGKGKGDYGKGKSADPASKPCYQFMRDGWCWYGNKCWYSHDTSVHQPQQKQQR